MFRIFMFRKSVFRKSIFALLAALLIVFCGSCAHKTPTLNLLVWEGYADPAFVQGLRRAEPL
jgi:spermidine/putrescine-binding protein